MDSDSLAEDIWPSIKCSLMGFWLRGVVSQVDHEKVVLGFFSALNVNKKQNDELLIDLLRLFVTAMIKAEDLAVDRSQHWIGEAIISLLMLGR